MAETVLSSPETLLRPLAALAPMRVWSVIITIFGDAVLPRGGVVPASVLTELGERLEIKPEAIRVALHRLARDGWIERSKSGRNSFYGLSAGGMAKFLPASRRIYAEAPAMAAPWRLAVLPQAGDGERNALAAAGYAQVTPGLFLGDTSAGAAPSDCLIFEGAPSSWPSWARDALAPPDLAADYAALEPVLEPLAHMAHARLPGRNAAALRVLMVHQWRRLLLRHPDVPIALLPEGWRGEACRALVLQVHKALSRAADPWLDDVIGPRGR